MLQKFFGCLLATALFGLFPESGFAAGGGSFHGGGMGGSGHSGPAFAGGHAFGGRGGYYGRAWPGAWRNGRNYGYWRGSSFRGGRFARRGFFRGRRFFYSPSFVSFGFGYPFWWDPWWYPGWGWSWGWDSSYYGDPSYYGGPSGYGDPGYSYSPSSTDQGYYMSNGQYGPGRPRYSYSTTPGNVDVAVQVALSRRGYYHGKVDGIMGDATQDAIRSFQSDNDLPVTGKVDSKLLHALRISTGNQVTR